MFNLYEILKNAQGGQAIDNLAAQFHITPEEADAAAKAIVPALSEGFLSHVSQPLGLGAFAGALGEGQHLAAFTDPAAAQDTATAQKGGDVLSQILGSHGAREDIALRASSATGIRPDILSQMLPVIASMIFGGITKSMQNQGFGGILGQLSNAVGQGGLGPVLSQILGGGHGSETARTAPVPDPAGGAGGLGSILGQILGGGGSTGPGQPQATPGPAGGQGGYGGILGSILEGLRNRPGAGPATGPTPGGNPPAAGFDTASIQAGLEALTKMLQPGTPPPAGPRQGGGVVADINDIMSGKRH